MAARPSSPREVAERQFDPSAVAPNNDSPPGTEDGDQSAGGDQSADSEGELRVVVASAEETRRGLVTGSYLDSDELDGKAQTIVGEISRGNEKLEHRWHFDPVPAGLYTLVLVARPSGLTRTEEITIEYEAEGRGRGTQLLVLTSSSDAAHEAELVFPEATPIVLKAKLPRGIRAEDVPTRALEVDYLAFQAQ